MRRLQFLTHFTIQPGRLDDFLRLAAASLDAVRSRDEGVARYDVFLDADRLKASFYREFADSDAALAHLDDTADLSSALTTIANAHHEVWGNPDPRLRDRLLATGAALLPPLLRLRD